MGNSASGSAAHSAPLVEAAPPALAQGLPSPIPDSRDAISLLRQLDEMRGALSTLRQLDEMRQSGAFTDCVLSVGDRHFRVHAVVVAGASRHLHASLTGGMCESAGELDADGRRVYKLELDGGMGVLSADALERLIEFMYTHRMDIGEVSRDELLGGAELLELPLARSFIITHMVSHLSLDTWLEVLTLGYKYGILELKRAGIAWVESRVGREIPPAALRPLPLACVQDLLKCENLQGFVSEDEVLDAAMSWAFGVDGDVQDAEDSNARGDNLAALLTRVRLPHLSTPKMEELRAHPLVKDNLACLRIFVDLSSFTGESHEGAEDADIGELWVKRKCFRTVPSSLVVFSEKKVFMFNAESSSFKPLTSSPIDLVFSACAVLPGPGDKVLCVEGPSWHELVDMRRTFCITLGGANGKGLWEEEATIPLRACSQAAAALNGNLYVAGGAREIGLTLSRVDRYSPASDTWEPVASMISKRECFKLVPIGGFLYAVGGYYRNPEERSVSMVERFDPATNTWAAVTTTDPRVIIDAAATMGGLLYVAGGRELATTGCRAECFCFNPCTVSWRKIANLPEPRWSVALSCLRGELYAMGGYGPDDDQGPSRCPIWRYKPVQDVWEDVPLAEGSATLFIDDNCSWCAM
jgi:hypothetical protein